ncbi:MAG: hypothetical protein ACM3X9_00970 [Bacillota bacterium]
MIGCIGRRQWAAEKFPDPAGRFRFGIDGKEKQKPLQSLDGKEIEAVIQR